MRRYLKIFLSLAVLFSSYSVSANGLSIPEGNIPNNAATDTLRAYFKVDKWLLDPAYKGNNIIVNKLKDTSLFGKVYSHFSKQLSCVIIEGAASPEGSQQWNYTLSQRRADQISRFITSNSSICSNIISSSFTGRDWENLRNYVMEDQNVPFRNEVLILLLPVSNATATDATLNSLKEIGNGAAYDYLYDNVFPKLRSTYVEFVYERIPKYGTLSPLQRQYSAKAEYPQKPLEFRESEKPQPESKGKFFMAIKTNLLYDLLITPNIGAEFRLGKHYSLQGNWMYAWWKSDPDAWYHRTYGGDISIRRWLGDKHLERPLTGWHMGIYGQILTYDFEWGGRGYLGDRWSWAAGVEGGYSKAIGKRLNLDFSINVGYLTGEYHEYLPEDGCYVWQSTKQRRWIGPTKAEVSLVWLLGRW